METLPAPCFRMPRNGQRQRQYGLGKQASGFLHGKAQFQHHHSKTSIIPSTDSLTTKLWQRLLEVKHAPEKKSLARDVAQQMSRASRMEITGLDIPRKLTKR
jgi:hypothetical protein